MDVQVSPAMNSFLFNILIYIYICISHFAPPTNLSEHYTHSEMWESFKYQVYIY